MHPLPASTAAVLLLTLVPLGLPDAASAAPATASDDAVATAVADTVGTTQPADPATPAVAPPAEAPASDHEETIPGAEHTATPAPAPAVATSGQGDQTDATPEAAPSTAVPTPATTIAEVAPQETLIKADTTTDRDVAGQPGGRVQASTLNVKNNGTVSIPERGLDYHWTLSGPGTFRSSNMPFAVTYTGSPAVKGCTLTSAQQIDCIGANPITLTTGASSFTNVRTNVFIDQAALPGDVVTLTGWIEPNGATGLVNTSTATSTTWKTWVPLTAAGIDRPSAPVGPTPTVTGTGVPGGTVDVSVAGRPAVTVAVSTAGTWQVPVTQPLDDGHVTVTAVQHRNGFTAAATTAAFDVDAVAPSAPVVDEPGMLADPTGPITGTAEPGSRVVVRNVGGDVLGQTTAGADGSFVVQLGGPLAEGDTELVVEAVDRVGNVSPGTSVTASVRDTTAPTAPVLTGPDELADGRGPVTGTAEPGATVVVSAPDGTELGRGTVNDRGDFSVVLDRPLPAGEHPVQVVVVDAAGNESDPTERTVTVAASPGSGDGASGDGGSADGDQGTVSVGTSASVLPAPLPQHSRSVAPVQGHGIEDPHTAAVEPADQRRELAYTGADLGGLGLAAVAALGLGALLRAGSRRRARG